VLVTKFVAGAWVSALLIAVLMGLMVWVRNHYDSVSKETASSEPLDVTTLGPPIVIVPIQGWTKTSERALQFALSLSPEIHAVHVDTEEETEELQKQWSTLVDEPIQKAGGKPPVLVTLPSPFRLVLKPILEFTLDLEKKNPERQIAVIVPELVERHWYHYPLHNQRAELLKAFLLLRGSPRIVLINVPWYIKA